jgi:predicted type IV restriction endonuclease
MSVPGRVVDLVERFEADRKTYRSTAYKEEWIRQDFIDPLFETLGWDVSNKSGVPVGPQREVIPEDAIRVRGATKAPDYGFYVGGARKFFVEAKKPSVNLAGDTSPAFQLRRYAWSAKLPLSVLTDFEEMALYDCRFEPKKEDGPRTARLNFLTYEQYPERWEEIASIFSKEAILSGSLETYAEETKRKRGTETVDTAFLKKIEGWRSDLARDLASRNDLNRRQLNHAVQMTIDRIIFLRMAEDRSIEEYGRLLGTVKSNDVYRRLFALFQEADDRYNSGLFHFRSERDRQEKPDTLTPALRVDDELLTRIIRSLYYPESPYEFSVLPVDVLGQVYEQFLGKVIRLEDDHNAVVEEKPEVRKAGGVYYTPTYVVDYIVEHTVGKLLEGKRPGPRGGASRLKIVDPAAGSGSFLIGAYQYLLDWHRDRYVEDGAEKHQKVLYQGPGGEWRLTIEEKKRILTNNIYGVDIDPQAVEVTKLSLLLKVLEGETDETLESQLRLFAERALPDLDDNIKCGNSLIGPDFYEDDQMALLDEEEHYRINVFDWKSAFPKVFSGDDPGFDTVIGNPPYLRIQGLQEYYGPQIGYFLRHYQSAVKRFDLYLLFAERGFDLLAKNGRLGFICPHKFVNSDFGSGLTARCSGDDLSGIMEA